MTPMQMRHICAGHDLRQKQQAYLLASLIRAAVWGKSMPKYEEVFPDDGTGSSDMDDEAMYRMAQSLNAMFGGKEE